MQGHRATLREVDLILGWDSKTVIPIVSVIYS